MADLHIPESCAQVSFWLRHAAMAREAAVTCGIRGIGGVTPTETDLEQAGTEFMDAWGSRFDNQVTLTRVQGTYEIGTRTYGSLTVPMSIAGSGVQSSPPPNVAVLVQKRTALLGRRGRGRMFFPWGVDESGVDEAGNIETAVRTAYQTGGANFIAGLASAGLEAVLLHTYPTTGSPMAAAPISAFVPSPIVATQRRRLRS